MIRSQNDQNEDYISSNNLTVTEKLADGLRYVRLNSGLGEIPQKE